MCLGATARAENEAARRQYNAAVENRKRNWMQQLSVQNLKNVQYEVNMDRSNVAMASVQSELQRKKIQNRRDAELKYEQAYDEVLKNSKYEKLLTGGATGQSVGLLALNEERRQGFALAEQNASLRSAEMAMGNSMEETRLKALSNINVIASKTPTPVMTPTLAPQPIGIGKDLELGIPSYNWA